MLGLVTLKDRYHGSAIASLHLHPLALQQILRPHVLEEKSPIDLIWSTRLGRLRAKVPLSKVSPYLRKRSKGSADVSDLVLSETNHGL
jgi:hypothetical protein